eukprot:4380325-Alexandrium_andersonii.AAC.1
MRGALSARVYTVARTQVHRTARACTGAHRSSACTLTAQMPAHRSLLYRPPSQTISMSAPELPDF